MGKIRAAFVALFMIGLVLLPWSGASAATDGFYNLQEVASTWDGTDADRTRVPTADYDYTYGDESSVSYTLPWPFRFYGQTFQTINVDTNGNVWFAADGPAHSFNLANTGRGGVIAAWNNDLTSYYYGGAFIQHKANPERLVIEWQTETYSDEGAGKPNNFEVVLYPDGTFRHDYKSFSVSSADDLGSGASSGNNVNAISVSSAFGDVFSLAGRSFQAAESAPPAAVIHPFPSPSGTKTLTVSGEMRGTGVVITTDSAATVGPVSYAADGYWNCTITGLAEGTNTISVTASGADGGEATTSVPLVVDTTLPAVQITSPVGPSNETPILVYSVSDGAVTVKVDGTEVPKISGEKLEALTAGDHTLQVVSRDTAGNTGIAESVFNVRPLVAIASPVAGLTNDNSPVLAYTSDSGPAVVRVDGNVVTTASGSELDPLPDGDHSVQVEIVDSVGNSSSSHVEITVDTTPPGPPTGVPSSLSASATSLVVHSDGTMWTWGATGSGLSDGGPLDNGPVRYSPARIGSDADWLTVVSGENHNLAIKKDGSLWGWGDNAAGQLGEPLQSIEASPVRLGYDSDWQAVAAGSRFTLALKTNGDLWAWGEKSAGQLGGGYPEIYSETPWSRIAAGDEHAVALKQDGSLWSWGTLSGVLGTEYFPIRVGSENDWNTVAAAGNRSYALRNDGTLWGWGYNGDGLLGDGTEADRVSPVRIGNDSDWVAISAGKTHVLALKADGSLWSWGINAYGEIGDGTAEPRATRVKVGPEQRWIAVSAGATHSLAVHEDGSLWAWGENRNGVLGDGTEISRLTPTRVNQRALSINGGATATNTEAVTLNMVVLDANGVVEMQFRNDNDDWSAPEPFDYSKEWVLTSSLGTKTVSARFKDSADNWSEDFSATITLSSNPVVEIVSPVAGTFYADPVLSYRITPAYSDVVVTVDGAVVNKWNGDSLGPLAGGQHTVRVEATNAGLVGYAEANFRFVAAPSVATESLPAVRLGGSYDQTLQASGGGLVYSWGIAAGNLPDGLALDAAGRISGFASRAGTYLFTVSVIEDDWLRATRDYTLAVLPMEIKNQPPPGVMGVPYGQTLVPLGGTAPHTWNIVSGALPDGLSLNPATGNISGTPTTPGTRTAGIQLSDADGNSLTKTFVVYILATNDPAAQWIRSYDGGDGTGDDEGWAIAADAEGNTYVAGTSWAGSAGSMLTIKYDSSGNVVWTSRYDDGGNGSSGKGIALDSFGNVYLCGDISDGTRSQYLTVKYDSDGVQQWSRKFDAGWSGRAVAIAVDAADNVVVTGNGSDGSTVRPVTVRYDPLGTLLATTTGGDSTMTARALAVDNGGNLYVTGEKSVGGNFDALTVKYDPSGNEVWTKQYDGGLDDGTEGIAVDNAGNVHVIGFTYTADGTRYALKIKYDAAGNEQKLQTFGPAWSTASAVAVDGSGSLIIAGEVFNDAGNNDYWIRKYDSNDNVIKENFFDGGSYDYAQAVTADNDGNVYVTGKSSNGIGFDILTIKYPMQVTISPFKVPAAGVGNFYSQTLTANGGVAPFSFESVDGELPEGLTLSGDGVISGTPAVLDAAGRHFTVKGTDSNGVAGYQHYLLKVLSAPTIATATLSDGVIGDPYREPLEALGGSWYGYVWELEGTLPPGLALSQDGEITGIPTRSGAYTFAVRVTDANEANATKDFTITVGVMEIADNDLPTGTVGTAYSHTLVPRGGAAPFNWSVVAGTLPAGLLLDGATGVLSGIPESVGVHAATFQVADANGNVVTKDLVLGVNDITVQWIKSHDGSDGTAWDMGSLIAVDVAGYSYLVGTSWDAEGLSIVAVKYDPDGNTVWTSRYNDGSEVYASGVTVDSSGNLYVAGEKYVEEDDKYNSLTLKFDAGGALQWSQVFVQEYDSYGRAITADAAGYVYVVTNSHDVSGQHMVTVKYDGLGNELMAVPFSTGSIYPNSIGRDGLGNVFITAVDDNGDSPVMLTVKYDSGLNEVWVKRHDYAEPSGIVVDSTGNAYVIATNNPDYDDNILLVKYDADGGTQWLRQFGAPASFASGVAVDSDGSVYVAGYDNAFVTLKYDSAGALLWTSYLNDDGYDEDGFRLAADSLGNLYLASIQNEDMVVIKLKKIESKQTLDSIAPTLNLAVAIDNSVTNNPVLSITGEASDAESGVKSVVVNNTVIAVDAAGAFNCSLQLSAGANTVTTVVTDNAGNQTSDSRTIIFDENAPTLSISASGSGTGVVTSSPAGISCGNDCSATFASGSSVTLAAAPYPGSTLLDGPAGDAVARNRAPLVFPAQAQCLQSLHQHLPPFPNL